MAAEKSLLELLENAGPLSAQDAALHLRVSKTTLARRAKAAGEQIVKLGRGQYLRYALPLAGYDGRAQWPLYWIDESGEAKQFAVATLVKPNALHCYGARINEIASDTLPWFLMPLTLRGFLGRASQTKLGAIAKDWTNELERWSLRKRAFAAQSNAIDPAGAILLGDDALDAWRSRETPALASDELPSLLKRYDQLAALALHGKVLGSVTDGVQPKFSVRLKDGAGGVREVLVKFSPALSTPFGVRWNDLLRAESHASEVLRNNGFSVSITRVLSSGTRTYFESSRMDRVGARGRRHVLPLSALHSRFVGGLQRNWVASIEHLADKKHIARAELATARTLFAFGQLIGNTDMHFGNLSLVAANAEAIARKRFSLAPAYDMLPMRFAPGMHDEFVYAPFEATILGGIPKTIVARAHSLAREFWHANAQDEAVSKDWREFSQSKIKTLA